MYCVYYVSVCIVCMYFVYSVLCVLYILYVYIVIMCTLCSIHFSTIHAVLCFTVFYRLGVSYFDVVYADIDRQVSRGSVCNSRGMLLRAKEFTSLALRSVVGEFRYSCVCN